MKIEPTTYDIKLARKIVPHWQHPKYDAVYRDTLKAIAEHSALERNISEQQKRKASAFDTLCDLVGDTRQASDSSVVIYQDDATHDYFVCVNSSFAGKPETKFAGTLLGAIEKWHATSEQSEHEHKTATPDN